MTRLKRRRDLFSLCHVKLFGILSSAMQFSCVRMISVTLILFVMKTPWNMNIASSLLCVYMFPVPEVSPPLLRRKNVLQWRIASDCETCGCEWVSE